MELRQLKQVLVLAETLNFHRAAEQLHMAQPPLSTSIKKLEGELGVLLFERLSTGLKLTPAGEVVMRYARRSLFFADEIRRAARDGQQGEQGRLRVGFVGSASFSLMPRIIRSYRGQFPNVELQIEESTSNDLLRRICDHTLDVVLIRLPVWESTSAKIIPLQRERMMLAVSADSHLVGRVGLELTDLGEEPFIVYSRTLVPAMHFTIQCAFQAAGIQPPIAQEAVYVQTVLGLVEGGIGVALVPESVCRFSTPGVVFLRLDELTDNIMLTSALAVLEDAVTPVAQHFIDHARRVCGLPLVGSRPQ